MAAFTKCLMVAIAALLAGMGGTLKPEVDNASPAVSESNAGNPLGCIRHYCPLSSPVPLPFYLWSSVLTFVIWLRSSTYTCRQRRMKESVGLLVRNCRRARVQYTQGPYHPQNICSPSNVASKAACYLDCISFLMFFPLWYGCITSAGWHILPPHRLKSRRASVLHVPDNASVFLAAWIIKWRRMMRQKSCTRRLSQQQPTPLPKS